MQESSLTSRVTDYVFNFIRDNDLGTGDSLPSEIRTSTELSVSRGIVREAFRSLEVAGIIEKGNGRSPKVGVLNSDFLTQLLLHALSTRQISLEEALDLRATVEVRAAELAATRRSNRDVQQLRAAILGMRRSAESLDDFVQHDLSFHGVINGAAGNVLLEMIGGAMQGCMRHSMRSGLQQRRHVSEVLQVVDSHALIANAIEARDSPRAGKLMKKHFAEAKRALRKYPRRATPR